MLIRKHLGSGELAYHYCYVPPQGLGKVVFMR